MFSLLNNVHTTDRHKHARCVCCDLYINYVEPLYDWVAYKIGCFFFYRSLSLLYFAFLASLSSYRFMLFACGITNTFAECNSYIEKRILTFKCMLLDSYVWLAHMAVDSVTEWSQCQQFVRILQILYAADNKLIHSKSQRILMQITFTLWISNFDPNLLEIRQFVSFFIH